MSLYTNYLNLTKPKQNMNTIIELMLIFLAILFTISLILDIITRIQYFNKYGIHNRYNKIWYKMIVLSTLYTLLFYWYN